MRRTIRFGRRRGERGVAMITAITVLAVLGAISATVATIGVSNIKNSDRDRQAGAALGASDAGVAQAIEYIRANGVGSLTCPEDSTTAQFTTANCSGTWVNRNAGNPVPLAAGATACTPGNCAKVWISYRVKYAPPAVRTGTYLIHSEGIYGGGPAARNVVVQISVTPDSFPIGVFGERLSGNGGTQINTESLFTTDCVYPRQSGTGNGTRFSGIDPFWGIPSAAHSTSHISTSTNCDQRGYIHATTPTAKHCPDGNGYNSASDIAQLKYDQSGDGGTVASGSPCYHSYLKADGTYYPDNDSTAFTNADLQRYGYRSRGLTGAQYATLKVRSQSQGLYNLDPGSLSARLAVLAGLGITQPVVYDDTGDVSLKSSYFTSAGFNRAPDGTCTAKNVTVVVEHGNLTFQGGTNEWTDLMVFVPDGNWRGDGGYNILGTLWAHDVSLGGNEQWQMDDCFVKNPPGPMLDLHVTSFREDDSKDVS